VRVRREARYRIVDIVTGVLEGDDRIAVDHGYTEKEYRDICDEIRRVLARHERYAAELQEPADAIQGG
jgi:hypothetical protein